MDQCATLGAGVLGAANGVARIYNFGTSVRATYYADFSGTVAVTTGADLPLDSNGGANVYVNQLVDVQCFDALGNLVRTFTEGASSPLVEVISQAFTGTDRTSGASGLAKPTTLQAVLDLWTTSAGAPDWKVLFNGVATTLQVAVASVAGLFFNVKDPTYGARGDGATDDTTPIQNCIIAAGLVKGTVIFPAGTYRITSTLSVPVGTSLWGVGSSGTIINVDSAAANGLTYAPAIASGSAYQEVRNLSVVASQSNSGTVVSVSGAAGVTLACYNSIFGAVLNTGTIVLVTSAVNDVLIDGCILTATGAANAAISADQTNARVRLRSSRIIVGLGAYNGTAVSVRNGSLMGNTFDMSGASSGTNTCLLMDGTAGYGPKVTVGMNEFIPPTGGTSTCLSITNANESTTSIAETGNIFRAGWTTVYSGFNAQSNIPSQLAVTRQSLGKAITDNTASVSIPADQYGYVVLTRTTNTAQTLTAPLGPGGAEFTLVVFNNCGGPLGTLTFAANFNASTTAIAALANGKIVQQHFRCIYANGAAAWNPVALITNAL